MQYVHNRFHHADELEDACYGQSVWGVSL